MSKKNRNNEILSGIARAVFCEMRKGEGFLMHCTEEQQVVFHEFAKFLQSSPRYKSPNSFDLANNYPFVKLHGEWYLSLPKAYLFFIRNRLLIASFPDSEGMRILYEAIQNSQQYVEQAKALDDKLSPRDYQNSDDYRKQMTQLYENYSLKQLELLS